MAGGGAHLGHFYGHHPAGFPERMGHEIRNPRYSNIGPGSPVYIPGMERVHVKNGNNSHDDDSLPPAIEWVGGKISPIVQELAPLHGYSIQFLDTGAPVGPAGAAQCPVVRHGNVRGRGDVQDAP